MPVYEIVLRYPHRDELRVTNEGPEPHSGDVLRIDGREWVVAAEDTPEHAATAIRVVCEPVATKR
jgi:hypothetical protein